jgi:hypothetical protein
MDALHEVKRPRAMESSGSMRVKAALARTIALVALMARSKDAGAATAETPRVEVQWTAPEGCPSAADVTNSVTRLTGGAAPREDVVVRAVVTTHPSGFRVVVAPDGAADRVIDAATCSELADATAIVVALMIAPTPIAKPAESTSIAPPLPPSITPPRSHVDEGPTPFAIAIDARGDIGSLPHLAEGFAASLAWTPDRYRFEITGTYWPTQTAYAESTSGPGGKFDLITVTLRACDALFGRRVISACAEFDVGSLRGNGFATQTASSERGLWMAPGGGILAAFPLGRALALRVGVDAFVPIFREDFYLANVGSVHRAAAVVGRGSLGFEFRF